MRTDLEEQVTALILEGIDPTQKLSQADAILYALPKLTRHLGTLEQMVANLQMEGLAHANGSSETFAFTTEGETIFISDKTLKTILKTTSMDEIKYSKHTLRKYAGTIAPEDKYTSTQIDELKTMFKVLLGLIPPPEAQEDEIPEMEVAPDDPE